MSNEKDGGPAFPRQAAYLDHPNHGMEFVNAQDGMTLRDYFAAHAQQIPASDFPMREGENTTEYFVRWRWHYADAMLAAREK